MHVRQCACVCYFRCVSVCVSVSVSVYHRVELMTFLHALLTSYLLPCNVQEDQDKVFYENLTAEESIEQGTYVLDDKHYIYSIIFLYLHHCINSLSFSIRFSFFAFLFLLYFTSSPPSSPPPHLR